MKTIKDCEYSQRLAGYDRGIYSYKQALKDVLGLIDELDTHTEIDWSGGRQHNEWIDKEELKSKIEGKK